MSNIAIVGIVFVAVTAWALIGVVVNVCTDAIIEDSGQRVPTAPPQARIIIGLMWPLVLALFLSLYVWRWLQQSWGYWDEPVR